MPTRNIPTWEKAPAKFDELGKKFLTQGQGLRHVEWRYSADTPAELVTREARAADLLILGLRRATGSRQDFLDPGVILLSAGRPIMVVPAIVHPCVAW